MKTSILVLFTVFASFASAADAPKSPAPAVSASVPAAAASNPVEAAAPPPPANSFEAMKLDEIKIHGVELYFLVATRICIGKNINGEVAARCDAHNELRVRHINAKTTFLNCAKKSTDQKSYDVCMSEFKTVFKQIVAEARAKPVGKPPPAL